MAAGKHVWQRAVPKVNHKNSNGFLRPSVPSSAEKNMKFQVHYRVHSPGKVKRATSCKRKSCGLAEVGVKLHRRSSDVGRLCDPGMANKENELTCSDDVRGCGFPVNSAEASKMAGASSKYSDFAELSKDHEAMTQVLFGRSLRLKVALTLWRKSASELVAYLIRIQDTGVLLDCLPVLTNNLQTEAPCLSLGCLAIHSNNIYLLFLFDHYMKVKWWPELSRTEKRLQDSCAEDRNMEVMKQRLKDLWKEGTRLCLVPGTTGELAKVRNIPHKGFFFFSIVI
uniref:Katanin p80 subunit B-like 1 n=1 Tax=Pundamilia nyererei TaxID=303518 RepID=A0A3B4EY13_9CICH